jgi:hypothetical protein
VIEITSGVRIKAFSSLGSDLEYYLQPFGSTAQNEDEILLWSGIAFVIDSIEFYTNGVTEVKMHEVPNPERVRMAATIAAPAVATPLHGLGGDSGPNGNYMVGFTSPSAPSLTPGFPSNMLMGSGAGGNGMVDSSDDDSDQFEGIDRSSSSAALLGESVM